MARLSFIFALSFCLLVLFHGSQARQQQSQRQQQCQVQNIDALQPTRKIRSEAGVTEHWDENNEQLDCAGVSVTRHTIQSRGLLLPHYHNAPKLIYIIQGRGTHGVAIPGCPEAYQQEESQSERERGQSQQHQSQSEREREKGQSQRPQSREREQESEQGQTQRQGRDQHQKVRQVRQGDIVAVPVGVPNWFYNDGETPLIMVTLLDTSNNENQLDQNQRAFYLGGNPQKGRQEGSQSPRRGSQQQQEQQSNNIFNGLDEQVSAEIFGVSTETARKLRGEDDRRGNIVRVENELQVIRPLRRQEEQGQQGQEQEQEEEEERRSSPPNGLEESLCNIKLRINVDNPSRADVYNPRAGRITRVNSRKLSILELLQLNVERGVLYRNALVAPHWNLNSHSVIYVTRGNARVQIVGNYQQPIFDGQLSQGQLLVVPQNFAVVKRAGDQGFEWIAFKTNNHAVTSPVAGRNSVIRALPEEILTNAFRISSEQARRLKFNRQEVELFAPNSQFSQERQ